MTNIGVMGQNMTKSASVMDTFHISFDMQEIPSVKSGHLGIGPKVNLVAPVVRYKFPIYGSSVPKLFVRSMRCTQFWLELMELSFCFINVISFSCFQTN